MTAQGRNSNHSGHQMKEGQREKKVIGRHPQPNDPKKGQRNAYEEAEESSESPSNGPKNEEIPNEEEPIDCRGGEEEINELLRHTWLILPQEPARMTAMLKFNRTALKEWAVVQRALAGGQILLLRKGGILEQKRGFTVEHREFFLFPTYVHQNEDDVIPSAHRDLAASFKGSPPADQVWFDYYAVADEVFKVDQLDVLRLLEGQHILSWSAIEARFYYRRPGLHLLALRVFRLPETVRHPNHRRYDGCVSWVELEEALPTASARPVLSDDDFHAKLEAARRALAITV